MGCECVYRYHLSHISLCFYKLGLKRAFSLPILASLRRWHQFLWRTSPVHNVCITSESFRLKVSSRSFAICPKLRSLVSCRRPSTSLWLFYTSLNSQFLKVSFYLNYEAVMLSNPRSEYDDFMNLLFTIFRRYHFTMRIYFNLLHVVKANFVNFLKLLSCVILSFTACLTSVIFQQYTIGLRDEFNNTRDPAAHLAR